MSKEELIQELKMILDGVNDQESAHIYADEALLRFIDDKEVEDAYHAIPKWYA